MDVCSIKRGFLLKLFGLRALDYQVFVWHPECPAGFEIPNTGQRLSLSCPHMPVIKEVVLGVVTRDFIEKICYEQFKRAGNCLVWEAESNTRTWGKKGRDPDLGGKRVGRDMVLCFSTYFLLRSFSFMLSSLSRASGSTGKMGSFILCGLCNVYEWMWNTFVLWSSSISCLLWPKCKYHSGYKEWGLDIARSGRLF